MSLETFEDQKNYQNKKPQKYQMLNFNSCQVYF